MKSNHQLTGGRVLKSLITVFMLLMLVILCSPLGNVYAATVAHNAIKIINQASASYTVKGETKPTVLLSNEVTAASFSFSVPTPLLKIEKTVATPVLYGGQQGVFDLVYTLKISNDGDTPANYVHLADNLNCTYRMYEKPRLIKSWALFQKPQVVSGALVINPSYSGNAPCASDKVTAFDTSMTVQMLSGKVSLPAHSSSTITYGVRLTLADSLTGSQFIFNNTAFATILQNVNANSAVIASDSAVTPVQINLIPPIDVVKTVSEPLRVEGQRNAFDLIYTIKATNVSSVPATYVHLADNLNCTYRMYDSAKPVHSWVLTQKPQITSGNLVINSNYTGDAPCVSDNVTAFDSNANVQLVTGSVTLLPHSSSTLTYAVRITLAPELTRNQRSFINTVYAVVLAKPNDLSAITAAAAAAAPVYPVDPSGVVYNSVTRKPIVGAMTTLTRVSCPADSPIKTGDPITQAQIFTVPGTTDTHIYNGTTSITQLTDEHGYYFYFFQQQDNCTYHLTVTAPKGFTSPSKLIPVTAGIAPIGFVQPQATPPAVGQKTTYYFDFILSLKGDVFNNHIPLDPASTIAMNIDVVKTVSAPRRIGKNVFELDYTISVKNIGKNVLPNVKIVDDLDCTFEMDNPNGPIADWQLVGQPVYESGPLVGTAFLGYVPGLRHYCNRELLNNGDPKAGFQVPFSLNFVDGKQSLKPQEQEVIRFTVRLTANPIALKGHSLTNKVFAGGFVNSWDSSATVADSDSIDALLIDPNGVVYDSLTRKPVAGAVVTFIRGKCDSNAAPELTMNQLAPIGYTYTDTGLNRVSLTTNATGEYGFVVKEPLSQFNCDYAIDIKPPENYIYQSWFKPLTGFAPEGDVVSFNTAPPLSMRLTNSTTPYYLHFDLGPKHPNGVFNNHIPLDPTLPIDLVKTVSTPVLSGGQKGVFDLTYTLKITNNSNSPVAYVHLADNLNCTYRMYEKPVLVKSWTLFQSPKVISGPLVINPSYTGNAPCSSDKVTTFERTANVQMLDGKVSLPAHGSSTITYGVRLVLSEDIIGTQFTFNNTAIATLLQNVSTKDSPILASASATIPVNVNLSPPTKTIGIAKRVANYLIKPELIDGKTTGFTTATYTLVVQNYSSTPAYNVQVTDTLENTQDFGFGSYSATADKSSQYTIVPGSLQIQNATAGVSAKINPTYTGQKEHANLLIPGVLPALGRFEISFTVKLNIDNHPSGIINNTAEVSANSGSEQGTLLTDKSVDGNNPDVNGNGNPTDDTSPTPVELKLIPPPVIDVQKNVIDFKRVSGQVATFDITYQIKVTNVDKHVLAEHVHLADNLNCAFRTYENPAIVSKWVLSSEQKPQVTDGPLIINPNYTGNKPCPIAQQVKVKEGQFFTVSESVSEGLYSLDDELQLADGSQALKVGQSSTIKFTVRITLRSEDVPRYQRTFQNVVFAVAGKESKLEDTKQFTSEVKAADVSSLPIDPSGTVYDAVTREPVAGAIVSLARSCGGDILESQIVNPTNIAYTYNAGKVSMVTGSDGAYSFILLKPDSCTYKVTVTPPAGKGYSWPSKLIPVQPGTAPGGAVQTQSTPPTGPNTKYYFEFPMDGEIDTWNNHIPLDPNSSAGSGRLFLDKKGSKTVAEVGDTVLYTLTAKNLSSTLTTATVTDILPRGFRLISGSVRLENQKIADPLVNGSTLKFNLSSINWENEATLTMTYLVQIGVGVSLDKSSINRAKVFAPGPLESNESAWPVTVTGGVFSDEAYLFGKVYLENCAGDKVQNKEEMGVPGIRLLLEDGTSVVTDIDGKYSLYGLSPITHVLKLDTTTLPAGSRLIPLSNRNSGKGDSQFVDLKKGELHKADFAISRCDASSVIKEVYKRYQDLVAHPVSEGAAIIRQPFNASYTTNTSMGDPRSLPATGNLTSTGIQPAGTNSSAPNDLLGLSTTSNAANAATNNLPATNNPAVTTNAATPNNITNALTNSANFQTLLPSDSSQSLPAERIQTEFPHRPLVIPLEDVMKGIDNNKLGFIDLKDADTLPLDILNVRVKGLLGSTLQLRVNDEIEALRRVGKKSKLPSKNLEAWEYIGVTLKAGSNKLTLEAIDPFGNVRETQSINVIAPGKAGRIEIDAPTASPADSKTHVKVKVRLVDDNGIPVTMRTPMTLEATLGYWEIKDLNPTEPGTQIFIEGGSAELDLIPPPNPGESLIKASSNTLQKEMKLTFVPELRPLIGVGILEGVVNFTKVGSVNVNAPNAYDAFERELRNLSVNGNDISAKGRAAFYFKGTVKGEYLLTAAYDSDKDTKQRLFRDIQPAKFYPIYGDSSLKSFDAQSTQRLYVRVDKQKSYLLYGDFTTIENNQVRKLSQYSRSVTGVKGHYENGDFSANAFASRDNLSQVITEIPANGTSGPYRLDIKSNSLYENSEKVEILVRDKNQPSIILETIPLTRFSDYAVDPLLNEIFFKGPVASMDANLNPRTIRVTYEVRNGGKDFWMGGVDARLKLNNYVELGASYARDENPMKKSELMGATAIVKLGDKTTLTAEVARTNTGQDTTGLGGSSSVGYLNPLPTAGISGEGYAERVAITHTDNDLKVDAQVTHADGHFNNPSAGFSAGRTEATVNANYKIAQATSAKGQVIYSKDSTSNGTRIGGLATIEHAFNDLLRGELGFRSSHESSAIAQPTSVGATPNDFFAIRAKLGLKLPWINGADVYTEGEQDVLSANRHMAAVGAGYLLNDKTRLYGRYQFISSLSNSSYSLNTVQQNNTAVFGIESSYTNDGRLFSEYRVRDAINGRESQAAVGLRQTWIVAEGLRIGGSFEMTHAFNGTPGSESKAITALAEYTANPDYKITGSLEARFASSSNSYLNTLGLTYKINDDWNLLGRNMFSLQLNHSDDSQLWRTRQQIGLAWRQVAVNRWNALGRYEHWLDKGGIPYYLQESHIVSTHINYQPHRDVITSARYAVKWSNEENSGIASSYIAHLLYGRATWDFLKDWDMSLQSGVFTDGTALQYAGGIEIGYQAMTDLWLSGGYNVLGFDSGHSMNMAGSDYTSQGFYARMRFKFDEGLFR